MLCCTWSVALLLLCARMPCAPVIECNPPCLIKPCYVVLVGFIQFCETQQLAMSFAGNQVALPLSNGQRA